MRRITFEKKKRPLPLLVLAVGSLAGLVYLILRFAPTDAFVVATIQIPLLPVFFVLLAILFYTGTTYVFARRKHGIMASAFIVIYLLFRINNLVHPFFLFLLVALFLTLELLFTSKKES